MIPVQEAQAIVRAQCACLESEHVLLRDCAGRVLARTTMSPVDLPPFDNSAMDGFALRCAGSALRAGAGVELRRGALRFAVVGRSSWRAAVTIGVRA